MFNTDARVQLSEFLPCFDAIVADAAFFCVGKIPTRAPAKLVPLGHERHLPELLEHADGIAAVACPPALASRIPAGLGVATTNDPLGACFRIHEALCARENHFWTRFPSRIAASAKIHPRAYVAEHDVVIGENVFVGPNATIQSRSLLGDGCHVGAGAVIGTEAYELARIDGATRLQAHAGGVRIGAGCIFLSNVTVVRSIFPTFTEIGDECSFDNLVHVAHDCILGRGARMTACSMLSGRVELGSGAYLGPNSTISNGVKLGEGAYVTIGATVVRDVGEKSRVTGNFAIAHDKFIRNLKESVR